MRKRLVPRLLTVSAVLASLLSGCADGSSIEGLLPERNWEESVREGLLKVLSNHSPKESSYAVFDCDNTIVFNDVTLVTMAAQIESLDFSFTPEKTLDILLSVVPDKDTLLTFYDGEGASGHSAASLAKDIQDDWSMLYPLIHDGSVTRKDIETREEYLDLRAKLWSLSLGVDNTFPGEAGLLFPAALYYGKTEEEVSQMASRHISEALSKGSITVDSWKSPDGEASVSVTRGLYLAPEMKDLFSALKARGIEPYICSASPEIVVEAFACNAKTGVGIDPSKVFGICLGKDESGRVLPSLADGRIFTYKKGKVECIRRDIAPLYGGASPTLAAGDSNGDYPMLTEFQGLEAGLIMNCLGSGSIASLVEKGIAQNRDSRPRYLVQGRDPSIPSFAKSHSSKPVK